MRVLMVAAEVAPLAKVGGLADMMGALPRALAKLGVDVAVAMPCYHGIREKAQAREQARFFVPIGDDNVRCTVFQANLPSSSVPVYLLANDHFFDRPQIYGEGGGDYADSLERFTFLCRGALALPDALGWHPQVVHAHDWHAALIPPYLRAGLAPWGARSLLTIHNLGYQGSFAWERRDATGLDDCELEDLRKDGQLNLLKGGIRWADMLTTVSPTYAREIRQQGEGLEDDLEARASDLFGVLNGIDQDLWDPAFDPHLWAQYCAEDPSGKATNKRSLQRALGLNEEEDVPLVGMVSRLAEQKGLDLVVEALDRMLSLGIQLVVLGEGDPRYEQALREAEGRSGGRIAVHIGFSETLAHRIEAGSDMFLMPSRFEPCGLNQMYSLRYGTVPVVRATGGLADTVFEGAEGNGLVFADYTAEDMLSALRRALEIYRDRPDRWTKIVERGMRGDYSWQSSAREYVKLYRLLVGGS